MSDNGHRREFNLEAIRTFEEVTEILTKRGIPMTSKVAWHLERAALNKLKRDPTLQRLATEFGFG